MIKRVTANIASFRDVEFSPHFNLVLAERAATSTERDSRNGLGKSLLLDILHFCLGARGTKGRGVVVDALKDWRFRVDFELGERQLSFSRAVADSERKWVYVDSPFEDWPVMPDVEEGRARFTTPLQNKLLGRLMFGLTEQVEEARFGPTYRSLFSYIVRRAPDGFLDPFTHDRNQQPWDAQVNVAYHLGLNWRDASEFQELRSEKRVIDQLSKAVKEGSLPSYLGSEGELEAERVRLASEIASRDERLAEFHVREDYRDIEDEASRLTEAAHQLVNENMRDRRFMDLYSSRLEEERHAVITGIEVERLFEEANLKLPDQVRKHLTDVKAFHDAVIENRRSYLEAEVERLSKAILDRDRTVAELDSRKADLMTVLDSSGALEEYTRLQDLLVGLHGRLHDLEARLSRLKEVTQAKAEWERRKTAVVQGARTRYDELREQRDLAISYFNANTEALYEAPGRLIIDVTDKGFDFDVKIDRSDSHGVSNMKIFCFDLMLMQLWSQRGGGPGVLVHDSALFDGVDERQVAAALELAYEQSEKLGFQYICTMNSDDLPTGELATDSPVLQEPTLTLSDADPSGMLLGIEF